MTTWVERAESFTLAIWGGLGAAVAAGLVYVFRAVFTNQAKVNKIAEQLQARDELRTAEMKAMLTQFERLHSEVSDLRKDIRALYQFEMTKARVGYQPEETPEDEQ